MIKIFAIGDIVGRAGRRALQEILPHIRKTLAPDVVICNGENAAGGFGLSRKVFNQLTSKFEIDCITTGNHWHDKKEIYDFIDESPNLLLPANMHNVDDQRRGLAILTSKTGIRFAVLNIYGKVFMSGNNRCPFKASDDLLALIPPNVKTIVVDVHAEATSEKQALAHYLSKKVSLVYGTHTHCPTADERILDSHTGFATDLGMTGAYNSVIGIRKEAALNRFLTGERKGFEPAKDDPWLCGVYVEVNENTGVCEKITRHRYKLAELTDEMS